MMSYPGWVQVPVYLSTCTKSCGDACHVGTPVMWGCLSCGDTCHVGTPVMWGHLSCGDACHVGTPVMWGHLSCGDTCHVGMPVMWGHLSCGDTCHVGMGSSTCVHIKYMHKIPYCTLTFTCTCYLTK